MLIDGLNHFNFALTDDNKLGLDYVFTKVLQPWDVFVYINLSLIILH